MVNEEKKLGTQPGDPSRLRSYCGEKLLRSRRRMGRMCCYGNWRRRAFPGGGSDG